MIKLSRFYLFVGIILLCTSAESLAQIKGIVKNANTLEPVPEVNIKIEGSDKGGSTNKEGIFSIPVDDYPVKLIVSAIGFETKAHEVYRNTENVIIYLKPTMLGLEEIVVSTDRIINPFTQSSPIARTSIQLGNASDYTPSSAVDLLRAQHGVFVQQTSIGQGSVYVRGRAGRDVLYLFNGLRMNPSFVRSGQNQYFGSIDPWLIHSLDVYRGPVSVYYGSDALSGGVNVTPFIPNFSTQPEINGSIRSVLNLDGNGEQSLNGKINYQSSKFAVSAGGSYRDFNYYKMSEDSDEALWFPYDETLSNADYQFKSWQISSKLNISESSDISAVSYFGIIPDAPRLDRVTLGYSIEEDQPGYTPRFGYYSNTSPLSLWANTIEYRTSTINPTFESVGIKAGFFRLKDHRKQQDYAYNNAPFYSTNGSLRDDSFALSDTVTYDNSTSNQFHFSADVRSSISNTIYIKWGADFSRDYVESEQFENTGIQRLSRYPNGSVFIQTGLFAQIDQEITDAFHTEYGIRYSYSHADIPFEGLNTERRYDPYSSGHGQLTGAVGLSYAVNSSVKLLSNLSTGFRAPNISDLSEVGIRRSDQFQTSSTDLKPEKTGNFDIGIKYSDSNVSAEFFAYWLHYFDKITRVSTGDIVNEFGTTVSPQEAQNRNDLFNEVQNVNANSLDLLGVEFNGDIKLNRELKSGLTFTYTWGELTTDRGDKEPADRVPPANGIVYIEFEPGEQLTIRPQFRYAFDHRRISPNEVSDIRISRDGTDGFVNVQLLISAKPTEQLAFTLEADNLMDTAYREHASSLDGLGRNFTFMVSYQF